jgi:hypothetical protein
MEIESKITVYEVDGQENYRQNDLSIKSHWNRDEMVVIKVGCSKSLTVTASELIKAVERCSGWR